MESDFKKFKRTVVFIKVTIAGLLIFPLLISFGCSSASDKPEDHLNAYCVRECVIETADSEICDTRCNCTVEKLSSGLTNQEFSDLAARITSNDAADAEDLSRFKDAFLSCKPIK